MGLSVSIEGADSGFVPVAVMGVRPVGMRVCLPGMHVLMQMRLLGTA